MLACRKASTPVVCALLTLLLPEGAASTADCSVADVADAADAAPAGSSLPLCSGFDIGHISTTKGLTPLLYGRTGPTL